MNRPWSTAKKEPSRELVPIDDLIAACPYLVRGDGRIVSAFARKQAAVDWAELRSFNDELKFVVHTANEIVDEFQDGSL